MTRSKFNREKAVASLIRLERSADSRSPPDPGSLFACSNLMARKGINVEGPGHGGALYVVDEGRKRVLAIVAGIIVARHLDTADDLLKIMIDGMGRLW
jgi:hypothetical protein